MKKVYVVDAIEAHMCVKQDRCVEEIVSTTVFESKDDAIKNIVEENGGQKTMKDDTYVISYPAWDDNEWQTMYLARLTEVEFVPAQ